MTKEAKNMAAAGRLLDILCTDDRIDKRYDGFVPIDIDLLSDFSERVGAIAFTDTTPDVLNNPLNISGFVPEMEGKPAQFVLARKSSPEHIRKMTNRFTPNGYIVEGLHLNDGFRKRIPVECKRSQRFADSEIIVPHGYSKNPIVQKEASFLMKALGGLQFTMENACSVYLKPDGAKIGFTFPIYSLDSAKELFKMREVEPGRKRRTALKHFVAEHSRRLPSDPNETIKIAKYLRGAERFNWDGFSCAINLPKCLLDMLEQSKKEARD